MSQSKEKIKDKNWYFKKSFDRKLLIKNLLTQKIIKEKNPRLMIEAQNQMMEDFIR